MRQAGGASLGGCGVVRLFSPFSCQGLTPRACRSHSSTGRENFARRRRHAVQPSTCHAAAHVPPWCMSSMTGPCWSTEKTCFSYRTARASLVHELVIGALLLECSIFGEICPFFATGSTCAFVREGFSQQLESHLREQKSRLGFTSTHSPNKAMYLDTAMLRQACEPSCSFMQLTGNTCNPVVNSSRLEQREWVLARRLQIAARGGLNHPGPSLQRFRVQGLGVPAAAFSGIPHPAQMEKRV